MTAKTDLLPLPEGDAAWYYIGSTHVYSADEMESYARANVAHATAPLQAEIEALRAEVETLRDGLDYLRQMQGVPDVLELRAKAARAERLAEALRGWWKTRRPVGWTEDQHRSCPHVNLATDAEKALATALLRDQGEG